MLVVVSWPGEEHQGAHGLDLVVVELAPLLVVLEQVADHVLAGVLAAVLQQLAEVLDHLLEALHGGRVAVAAVIAAGAERDMGERERPVAEPPGVLLAGADQLRDHGRRERIAEPGDQVLFAGGDELVERLVDQPLDLVLHRLDALRAERVRGQRAQTAVIGRVRDHHPAGHQVVDRADLGALLRGHRRQQRPHTVRGQALVVHQRCAAVVVTGDDPAAVPVTPMDRVLLAQGGEVRVGIVVDLRRQQVHG